MTVTCETRRRILSEEYRRALDNLTPRMVGIGALVRPMLGRAQRAAAKGIAQRRALVRIDALEHPFLPAPMIENRAASRPTTASARCAAAATESSRG